MKKKTKKYLYLNVFHTSLLIYFILCFLNANALYKQLDSKYLIKSQYFQKTNSIIKVNLNKKKIQKGGIKKLISKVTNPETYSLSFNKVDFQLVIVNTKYNDLKIINNGTGKLQGLDYYYGQNPKVISLMNAGMFEKDGTPVGLLITNKIQIKRINLKKDSPGNFFSMQNAVFYVDVNGKYFVKNSNSFNEKYNQLYSDIVYATQSGPILTTNGKINTEFDPQSSNKLVRNGIGVFENKKNNIAIFIISDGPCTFYDLAYIFKSLGCDNSMYLDGTVSKLFFKNNKSEKPKYGDTKLGPVFSVTPKNG